MALIKSRIVYIHVRYFFLSDTNISYMYYKALLIKLITITASKNKIVHKIKTLLALD